MPGVKTAVVEAVASVEGVEPTGLDTVLADAVATDALATLASHEDRSWTLTFDYEGHQVAVRGDGAVLVDGIRCETWTCASPERPLADAPELRGANSVTDLREGR